MSIAERAKLREIVKSLAAENACKRTRLDRMPEETAQDWIEHLRWAGTKHRDRVPPQFRAEVLRGLSA